MKKYTALEFFKEFVHAADQVLNSGNYGTGYQIPSTVSRKKHHRKRH